MEPSTMRGSRVGAADCKSSLGAPRSLLPLAASLILLAAAQRAEAQDRVVGFGSTVYDSAWNDEAFVELAPGSHDTAARRADGSVVVWGRNGDGECRVPPLSSGVTYVALSAGKAYEQFGTFSGTHILALRSDGSVVGWGETDPASAMRLPSQVA